MKDFKEIVQNDLVKDDELKFLSEEKLLSVSKSITHNVSIYKSTEVLDNLLKDVFFDKKVLENIKNSSQFLLLTSELKEQNEDLFVILEKQHAIAVSYVQELYNEFNFNVYTAIDIVFLRNLANNNNYIVEDKTNASFLFKQTMIPILKRF